MNIFKRRRMHSALEIDEPPGSLIHYFGSGYTDIDLFVKGLKHFNELLKLLTRRKFACFYGHFSNSKNLEQMQIVPENEVFLLQLSGNTTICFQPLVFSIIKPFQTFCDAVFSTWLRRKRGENVKLFAVTALLAEAHSKAAN
jgi:hypothetical protein